MGLTGKLICQTSIKTDGDVIHDIFGTRPHHASTMTPKYIQGCDLHEGEFGKAGSTIIWKYTIDGKPMIEKHRVEVIDEEEKTVLYNIIEGDLLKSFKIFAVSVNVDTTAEDHLVTWSIEYEKVDESVKDPTNYLDFVLGITRDIEAHHLPK